MTLDSDRLTGLAATKLGGLLATHLGDAVDAPAAAGSGAALVIGEAAWIYQPRDPEHAVGRALVWAARQGVRSVNLLLDDVPDFAAFSLAGCTDAVSVYQVDGRDLVLVDPTDAPVPVAPAADHPLLPAFEAEGLDIVAGHGMWLGEVLGLEVARLVGSGPEIQLGVGAYDRGAFEALHPDQSPIDALPRVVADVARHRHAGAAPHLLNRLVRERWLRAVVCTDPEVLGIDNAQPIAGLSSRPGLHETVPDAALGHVEDIPVLVVTGVGIDPEVLSHAAGLAAREGASRVVIAVPERDRHQVVADAASFISGAVTVVGVTPPWEQP